eukprot:6486463-Amphidinium_carterae.2
MQRIQWSTFKHRCLCILGVASLCHDGKRSRGTRGVDKFLEVDFVFDLSHPDPIDAVGRSYKQMAFTAIEETCK